MTSAFGSPLATPDFRVLWATTVGTGDSHMMVIQDGTIYAQVTDGSLVAVDLKTGVIRAQATNVAIATSPFVVRDWVYSWRPGLLTELDRFTLQPRRSFRTDYDSYFENIPYDKEIDAFFPRILKPGADYPNDIGGFSRKAGREL